MPTQTMNLRSTCLLVTKLVTSCAVSLFLTAALLSQVSVITKPKSAKVLHGRAFGGSARTAGMDNSEPITKGSHLVFRDITSWDRVSAWVRIQGRV
jgi:hypothetical protein